MAGAAGCAATSASHAAPVAAGASASPLDVDWMLVWIDGFSGDPTSLIPLPGLILTTEAHRLVGESSCNRISGGYTIDVEAGSLRFGSLRNTRRLCQLANSEADDAMLRALLATDGFTLADGRLALLSKGRVVARLRAK